MKPRDRATARAKTTPLSRPLRRVVPRAAHDVAIEAWLDAGSPARSLVTRSDEVGALIRHRLDVPPGARRVVVRGKLDGRGASFALDLGEGRKLAWLDEARTLRSKGEPTRARALADAHAADEDAERTAAKGLSGAARRRRPDPDAADCASCRPFGAGGMGSEAP